MKKGLSYFLIFISFTLLSINVSSQVVTGKLVDENGDGLSSVFLQLYIYPDVYNATSSTDGSFYFDNITDVIREDELPSGYEITNNFPNPFNPSTRIGIIIPVSGNVKLTVYNILGQRVLGEIDKYFNAGANYIDIELEGLPSGFYIAKISIDDKYSVVKKMMLIYGSQHLSVFGNIQNNILPKSNGSTSTDLDSLVATSSIIGRESFTNLTSLVGDTLDLGDLTIERYCLGAPTVQYLGKIYNTVQIGDQCWLKENLDVGVMIPGIQDQSNNSVIEKYCYNNDTNNCNIYGGLYQWDEAMKYTTVPGAQGICPPGWHIPTLAEFQTLKSTVSDNGNALKAIGQGGGSGTGTNTSGFSALLAGIRSYDGWFYNLFYLADFWTSIEYAGFDAYVLAVDNLSSNVFLQNITKIGGVCVRCIRD